MCISSHWERTNYGGANRERGGIIDGDEQTSYLSPTCKRYFSKLLNVFLQIAKCNSPTCKKHFCKKCHQSNLYSVVFTVGESIMELDQVHLACRTLLLARVNRMTGMIRVGYFWWEIFLEHFWWDIFDGKFSVKKVWWKMSLELIWKRQMGAALA